jgi:hypothetical protein
MKKNGNTKVGQALVSCIALNGSENELEFTWVQIHRGFESLVGQCIEYPIQLPASRIRLGDRSKGDTQAIVFDPQHQKSPMLDGKQYAVLIKWDPASNSSPKILSFASAKRFQDAVEALEVERNRFVPTPDQGPEIKKKPFKLQVVEKVEDKNFYRVKTGGRIVLGTIAEIVLKMTHLIEEDPTEMLLCGLYEKKGSYNRYTKCDRPAIPEPNNLLIQALKKKQA